MTKGIGLFYCLLIALCKSNATLAHVELGIRCVEFIKPPSLSRISKAWI